MKNPTSSIASPNAGSKRLFGLDIVRATAILMVLLAHTIPDRSLLGLPVEVIVGFRKACGMLGVELFFVLSGFLIGGILLEAIKLGRFQSARDLVEFWRRRWWRTVPLYLLFVALHFVLELRGRGTLPAEWWHFLSFSQSLAWPHPKFFPEAWSLAVEEWFYLLFPLALLSVRKIWPDRHKAFLLCSLVFLVVPIVLRSGAILGYSDAWAKITLYRLDAILFGVILAYVSREAPRIWRLLRNCWLVGLTGVLAAFVWLSVATETPIKVLLERTVLVTFSSCFLSLVVAAATEVRDMKPWFAIPVRSLSLWSYSLYLGHGVVNGYIRGVFKLVGVDLVAGSCARFVAVWIGSIATAALLYRFFEKPLLSLRDRHGAHRKSSNTDQSHSVPGGVVHAQG